MTTTAVINPLALGSFGAPFLPAPEDFMDTCASQDTQNSWDGVPELCQSGVELPPAPPAKRMKTQKQAAAFVTPSNSQNFATQLSSTPLDESTISTMLQMQQGEAIKLLRKKRKDKEDRRNKSKQLSSKLHVPAPSNDNICGKTIISDIVDDDIPETQDTTASHLAKPEPCLPFHGYKQQQQQQQQQPHLPPQECAAESVIRHQQQHVAPAPPEPLSILHRVCMRHAQSSHVIKSVLSTDSTAAGRRAILLASRSPVKVKISGVFNTPFHSSKSMGTRKRLQESYPLHIALRSHATTKVVHMLVGAAPEVLLEADDMKEGGATPLGTALAHKAPSTTINFLLCSKPQAASIGDRRLNLPLHTAIANGYDLDVVSAIAYACPGAIHAKNFHGDTPLDIAQKLGRSARANDVMVNHLHKLAFRGLESQLEQHL